MPAHSPTASSWQALCLLAPRKSPPPAPTAERASALLLQPPGVVWQWGTFNNCAVAGDDDDEDGDAEAVASPPARQTSGGHRGSYEPHHDFQSETYRMVQGSEAPAHHGTIQQLHLHDPMGVEPPIKELPGEHEPHPISPTAAAASLAKVNLEAAFSAASREESGSPKTPPPQAQHPLVSDSA